MTPFVCYMFISVAATFSVFSARSLNFSRVACAYYIGTPFQEILYPPLSSDWLSDAAKNNNELWEAAQHCPPPSSSLSTTTDLHARLLHL